MSLADLDAGGYELLSALEDEAQNGTVSDSTANAPRFGRRAAPSALDHEALSKETSRRASVANMPAGSAAQDRRESIAGRRGTKRPVGTDDVLHSVSSSTNDVRLPQIRTSHNTGTGMVNGRRRTNEAGPAAAAASAPSRHSATSPSANGTAGRQYPARPQSTMETGTVAKAEADDADDGTETFLNDRVSVQKGSFSGGRGGWVREQARRLEEQVAAAQALANSPHSLTSIRQRSAGNGSWRQRMEGSMSLITADKPIGSPEKHVASPSRRESSAPANAAEAAAAANRAAAAYISRTAVAGPTATPTAPHTRGPQPSSAPLFSSSTSAVQRPASQAALRRNLAPITTPSPGPSTSTGQAARATPRNTGPLGGRAGRSDLSSVQADNVSQQTHDLAHAGVPDSILSAEYGHALGTMDWNHEYDLEDLTELFPPPQSLQSKFAIGGSQPKKSVKGTGAIRGTPTPDRAAVPLRQQTGPVKPSTKHIIPSAPSSGSTHGDRSLAGITPTNASNTSRIDAALDKPSSLSTPSPVVSPGAKGGADKPTDGSLYTAAQRAKLEAWQSIPILSYRPADAERYTADCDKYFAAPRAKKSGPANLFRFPVAGKAPPEMAGEAVDMNYEIHNVLTLLRHRHRKPMWNYPAMVPIDLPVQTRQRRPRTPRSFYGPEMPDKGNDWFRGVLDDATRVPSPDLADIEAREAEEKKLNPKALKGVDPEVANAHREQKEMDRIEEINKAAVPIEA